MLSRASSGESFSSSFFSAGITRISLDSLRCLPREPFDFIHNPVQLVGKRGSTCLYEDIEHRPVVPQRPFLPSLKPFPDLLAQVAVVAEDAARVVEFVGSADEPVNRPGFPGDSIT